MEEQLQNHSGIHAESFVTTLSYAFAELQARANNATLASMTDIMRKCRDGKNLKKLSHDT
jgi:hypothetical protein